MRLRVIGIRRIALDSHLWQVESLHFHIRRYSKPISASTILKKT